MSGVEWKKTHLDSQVVPLAIFPSHLQPKAQLIHIVHSRAWRHILLYGGGGVAAPRVASASIAVHRELTQAKERADF